MLRSDNRFGPQKRVGREFVRARFIRRRNAIVSRSKLNSRQITPAVVDEVDERVFLPSHSFSHSVSSIVFVVRSTSAN